VVALSDTDTATDTVDETGAGYPSDTDYTDYTETNPSTALTPNGQGTVIDDVTSENNKEFFTFSTPDGNTFYLVVDKERENNNIYLLNAVTESDLSALAEQDKDASESAIPVTCICKDKCEAGEVNTQCPVCVLSWKDCSGVAAKTDEEEQPQAEETEKSGGSGAMVLILVVVLAVGGAGYYLKIYKPKKELENAEDFDDLIDNLEEVINEDEDPELEPEAYPEPDEPNDYGYDEEE